MKKDTTPKQPIKIGKFIDPLTDFGFKRLFGSEPNKELLIDFLNTLFRGQKVITDLTYNKNEHLGHGIQNRKAIFDLTCTGNDGEQFIIEVQRIRQQYFKDRVVYYASRLLHNQAPQDSHWNYSLKEVYFVGLMDFVFDDSDTREYLHPIHLAYKSSGKVFYKKLEFIFIEIPKFVKTERELESGMDKWMFVLKNMSRLNKIPIIINKQVFVKLFKIAAVANLTKEEFMKYEKDLMAAWDEYAIKETLQREKQTLLKEKQAMLEEKQAMLKEKQATLEQGREEGLEKGILKGKTEVVKNLIIKMGMTDPQAADIAEVPVNFVKKVRSTMKK